MIDTKNHHWSAGPNQPVYSTHAVAMKPFRRAVQLCSGSLEATKDLVVAHSFNGDLQESKVLAMRTSQMTDKESDRRGLL